VSFARCFWLVKDRDSSAPAGSPACAVMLLSESMIKVAIATPFIALFQAKAK